MHPPHSRTHVSHSRIAHEKKRAYTPHAQSFQSYRIAPIAPYRIAMLTRGAIIFLLYRLHASMHLD